MYLRPLTYRIIARPISFFFLHPLTIFDEKRLNREVVLGGYRLSRKELFSLEQLIQVISAAPSLWWLTLAPTIEKTTRENSRDLLFCALPISLSVQGLASPLTIFPDHHTHQQLTMSQIVYTTQVNSSVHTRWLASSEVISQVLFTSKQRKKNKHGFCRYIILSQVKLLFGPLRSLVNIHHYLPLLRWIIVNYNPSNLFAHVALV